MSINKYPVIVLSTFIVLIIVSGFFQPARPIAYEPFSPPNPVNLMGTDQIGRDIWGQLSTATSLTVIITALACMWACFGGIALGCYSGLSQSNLAFILLRFIDVFLPIPSILLAMILLLALSENTLAISLAVGLPLIPFAARHSRALVLPIAGKDYVKASIVAGGSLPHIISIHILTSLKEEFAALIVTTFSWCFINLTSLDFLGLLGDLSFVSLGRMLNEGRIYLLTVPWMIIPPGMMVILIMICLNLLITGKKYEIKT